MASFSEKNYLSVNTTPDAAEKDWSLTGVFRKSFTQACVLLNSGKEFPYATRWPISDGDIAIIGDHLPVDYQWVEQSSNSGQMGIVTATEPKLTINRKHAVELDYVFTPETTKKNVKDCIKYLEMPFDRKIIQYDKNALTLYPMAVPIRRMLAAASILAHEKYADENAVGLAKDVIANCPTFNDILQVIVKPVPGVYPDFDLSEIQVVTGKTAIGFIGESKIAKYVEDGASKKLDNYVVKFTYIGAISIMVRGGFTNLLIAFLSEEPPIKEYYNDIIKFIGDTGNTKALEILKQYKPQK